MGLQDDEEEQEEQAEEKSMSQDGDDAGLHVEEVHRAMLPRQLQDDARTQERKQSRGDDGGSPVLHGSPRRRMSTEEGRKEGRKNEPT
ncbi:unnamed protein product [Musa acuminata subsp. malaccensis]|uniref:(wild Malaysian banana) hypothetical protein n=1 Tax=Musa acuminata subsp. malaccensis TaxID=214687 RepID=A0A8D6ZR58_MUSAM|nr:unnamed protein product [Musa acuminata subsp. malaccensis]